MHTGGVLRIQRMLAALLALLGASPASAVDERPIAEPRHPRLTCYAGYLKREAPHGLEGVRAAIRGTSHSRYARYTASQLRLLTLAR